MSAMTMCRVMMCTVVAFGTCAGAASAQCTAATNWDVYVSTSATMGGAAGSYVGITARTQEPPGDPCNSYLQSEAWLNPGGTPTVQAGVGTVDATATWSGSYYYTWTGTTKHWYIYRNTSGSDTWQFRGSLDRSIDLGPPPYAYNYGCEPPYIWDWYSYSCIPGYASPILISLRNNSRNYRLTSAVDGVPFDIDADGVLDQVAWTSTDSDVAFLVLDRNDNGVIDDGSELFGTATRKRDGSLAADGFDALLDLDGGPAVSDGRMACASRKDIAAVTPRPTARYRSLTTPASLCQSSADRRAGSTAGWTASIFRSI